VRPGDWLGAALATGDFNGDGCDDLAVGAPGADRAGLVNVGVVWALFGGPDGLANDVLLLAGLQLGGSMDSGDYMGMVLAAGDLNCDGIDDLTVGVPYEEVAGAARAGAVTVALGGAQPFRAAPWLLTQGSGGLGGILEAGDLTGAAVATGDHDGDGCDELAVGSPGEDLDGGTDAGAVTILDRGGPEVLYRGRGLRGPIATGDRVGAALAFADRNCNGRDELVVGGPGIDVSGAVDAGSRDGPNQTMPSARWWSQPTSTATAAATS
jgi:hypothetical protein